MLTTPNVRAAGASAALDAAPATKPAPRTVGYFQRRWPAALIIAAFPALALPMAAAVLLAAGDLLLWGYIWLFGMTHFVITVALYLRSDNLRHFATTRGNRVVFFLVPVLVFVGFDLYHALRVGVAFPVLGVCVFAAVRLADFNHFNRQTFGVLQLFKGRTGARSNPGAKRAEGAYFLSLTGLMFVTFLAGGVCPLAQPGGPLTVVPVGAALFAPLLSIPVAQIAWAGLAALVVGGFVASLVELWRAGRGRSGFAAAVAYLLVQTVAAAATAVYLPLYLAALAVHYVEYHVLMAPRCLRRPPEPTGRLDRVYGAVAARPVAFYLLVVAAAAVVAASAHAGMGMMGRDPSSAGRPFEYLALIAVFDGLFVFHYFVEMFVWKFSDPHFRRELSALYFAPPK